MFLFLVGCGGPKIQEGVITSVKKDKKIVFSSRWHYTYKLEDGTTGRGVTKVLIEKGWLIEFRDNRLWKIVPNK